jgi:RNA polymerase sigma-70 factor (ECF subfamily)
MGIIASGEAGGVQRFLIFRIIYLSTTGEERLVVNEEELLRDIASDPRKFGELYEAFYQEIFGYVFRRTADYDAAKDIAAETFLKAFVGIGKFKWRNISVLHWLYRIATNELNRYFNSRRYRPQSLTKIHEEYGFCITDYSNAETERILAEELLQRHQDFVKINDLMGRLGTKYQEVLALRFYEQKSIEEIAVILGKKTGTVKSLLSRGVDKLRQQL